MPTNAEMDEKQKKTSRELLRREILGELLGPLRHLGVELNDPLTFEASVIAKAVEEHHVSQSGQCQNRCPGRGVGWERLEAQCLAAANPLVLQTQLGERRVTQ